MNGRERWLVATTEYAGVTGYTGGIGRHYAALLPALQASGADVDLLVLSDGAPIGDLAGTGIHLVDYVRTERMSRTAALGRRAQHVRDVYRSGDYDRVFLPEWGGLGASLPRDAPLLTNLATGMRLANAISGITLRDLPEDSRLPVAVQAHLEERQIRRSAGLIAISTAMATRVGDMFGPLPATRVVPNCIDVTAVRDLASRSPLPSGWPEGSAPTILFLGRSERRKGVVDAVAAFGELVRVFPDARLVLAGAGGDARFEPTRAALTAMVPEVASDRLTWLGHVGGAELYAAIAAADVVVAPSRWEGFGNVALEAKAVGTPLVVTSGSGFDDFCDDGIDCLMVPPADPPALAAAVQRILRDPADARARASRASDRVVAFAPAPVAKALRAAADELLGAA